MRLRTIVWKELWERPGPMLTCVLAILLGVAALVTIRHVSVFSEREVAGQMEALGANILILPKNASLQDYYSADQNGLTLAEECVDQVMLAGLTGVEKMSPKLCVPVQVDGRQVTLTGILPQSEFASKAAWQTVAAFDKPQHVGCKNVRALDDSQAATPESLASQRTIEQLGKRETVLGAEVAAKYRLPAGSTLKLFGESFKVLAVLPTTGTVDDSRIFAHLHAVQELTKAGQVVSAVEVLGCCEDAAGQLVPQLSALLPDAKVVTISQVVQTQVGVNRLMARSSAFVLIVLILVGGAGVTSAISANVRERRREIGTLMALGAAPSFVSRLFLIKAAWLGLAGGLGGGLVGVTLAVLLGPRWAGVSVTPLPGLVVLALLAACGVTLLAAYWPARQASRLDPCTCFQEV